MQHTEKIPQVFLSHRWQDGRKHPDVRDLEGQLRNHRIPVQIDDAYLANGGGDENWWAWMAHEVAQSQIVVAAFTREYLELFRALLGPTNPEGPQLAHTGAQFEMGILGNRLAMQGPSAVFFVLLEDVRRDELPMAFRGLQNVCAWHETKDRQNFLKRMRAAFRASAATVSSVGGLHEEAKNLREDVLDLSHDLVISGPPGSGSRTLLWETLAGWRRPDDSADGEADDGADAPCMVHGTNGAYLVAARWEDLSVEEQTRLLQQAAESECGLALTALDGARCVEELQAQGRTVRLRRRGTPTVALVEDIMRQLDMYPTAETVRIVFKATGGYPGVLKNEWRRRWESNATPQQHERWNWKPHRWQATKDWLKAINRAYRKKGAVPSEYESLIEQSRLAMQASPGLLLPEGVPADRSLGRWADIPTTRNPSLYGSRTGNQRPNDINEVVDHLRDERDLYIVGPPGSGRSSALRAVLAKCQDRFDLYESKYGLEFVDCGATVRAVPGLPPVFWSADLRKAGPRWGAALLDALNTAGERGVALTREALQSVPSPSDGPAILFLDHLPDVQALYRLLRARNVPNASKALNIRFCVTVEGSWVGTPEFTSLVLRNPSEVWEPGRISLPSEEEWNALGFDHQPYLDANEEQTLDEVAGASSLLVVEAIDELVEGRKRKAGAPGEGGVNRSEFVAAVCNRAAVKDWFQRIRSPLVRPAGGLGVRAVSRRVLDGEELPSNHYFTQVARLSNGLLVVDEGHLAFSSLVLKQFVTEDRPFVLRDDLPEELVARFRLWMREAQHRRRENRSGSSSYFGSLVSSKENLLRTRTEFRTWERWLERCAPYVSRYETDYLTISRSAKVISQTSLRWAVLGFGGVLAVLAIIGLVGTKMRQDRLEVQKKQLLASKREVAYSLEMLKRDRKVSILTEYFEGSNAVDVSVDAHDSDYGLVERDSEIEQVESRFRQKIKSEIWAVPDSELGLQLVPAGAYVWGYGREIGRLERSDPGTDHFRREAIRVPDIVDSFPQVIVKIDAFVMMQHEVTQAQWRDAALTIQQGVGVRRPDVYPRNPEVVGSLTAEAAFSSETEAESDQMPMERVPFCLAAEFANYHSDKETLEKIYDIKWFNLDSKHATCSVAVRHHEESDKASGYRLPTEQEFEYAARAGLHPDALSAQFRVSAVEPKGDREEADRGGTTRPVCSCGQGGRANVDEAWCPEAAADPGSKAAEALHNPWGFCDLLGNVWEMTTTKYTVDPLRSPVQPMDVTVSGTIGPSDFITLRGGSWFWSAEETPLWLRYPRLPAERWSGQGFRLVRAPFDTELAQLAPEERPPPVD